MVCLSQTTQGSNPAPESICCVTLGKCLDLSEPLFPHMQRDNCTFSEGLGDGQVVNANEQSPVIAITA